MFSRPRRLLTFLISVSLPLQVAQFNHEHTVSDIRRFIAASRPDMGSNYSLMTAFPSAELSNEDKKPVRGWPAQRSSNPEDVLAWSRPSVKISMSRFHRLLPSGHAVGLETLSKACGKLCAVILSFETFTNTCNAWSKHKSLHMMKADLSSPRVSAYKLVRE